MPRGRPKGSKNKPKLESVILDPSFKPTIILGKNETEKSLVWKMREAYRKHEIYGMSVKIGKTIWESGSYEAKDIQLAIKAAKTLVIIEGEN